MDIIIFGGQSNMQGQTEGLPQENEPVAGALEYRYLTDECIPLQHPVGEDVRPENGLRLRLVQAVHAGLIFVAHIP